MCGGCVTQATPKDDLHNRLEVAAGGLLWILPGTHTSGGTKLTPEPDTTIIAHGATIETQDDEYLFDTDGADGVTIDGGVWDGSSQTDGTEYLSAVRLGETEGSEIRNATVQNGGYYGLNIPESDNVRVDNVVSRFNYRHGVRPQTQLDGSGTGYYLTDVRSYGNGKVGINVRYAADTDATITLSNVRSHHNGSHGLQLIEDDGTVTFGLSHVRSWENGGRGVFVEGGELDATAVRTTANGGRSGIQANDARTVTGTDMRSIGDAGNGQTYRECDRVVLANPLATDSEGSGIELRSSEFVSITNPRCENNGQCEHSAGINISDAGDKPLDFVTVTGGRSVGNWQNIRARATSGWLSITDLDAEGSVDADVDVSFDDESDVDLRTVRGA